MVFLFTGSFSIVLSVTLAYEYLYKIRRAVRIFAVTLLGYVSIFVFSVNTLSFLSIYVLL